MKKDSLFIVFEGLDGAGTTTQSGLLKQYIESKGRRVFLTHEPTDNPIGRLIRSVLRHEIRVPSQALALLYSADRADHLYNEDYGIIKHLSSNEVVISDRYLYSSIAYQGVELDAAYIRKLNEDYIKPDAIIFVDTTVNECMNRIDKRGEEKELFDKTDYLDKVRELYLKEFKASDSSIKYLYLNGNEDRESLKNKIQEFIDSLL